MRLLLALILLGVPALEIWVLVQVGQTIGGWSTAALLLAGSLGGAWILLREGRRALGNLTDTLQGRWTPERGAGGGMVVAGGALLLTPGFVTDVLALLCLLPLTRPLVRGLATRLLSRRIHALAEAVGSGPGTSFGGTGSSFGPAGRPRSGPVIHGEVVRDEPGGSTGDGRDLPAAGPGR